VQKAEYVSFYTHLGGFVLALIGTVLLVFVTWGSLDRFLVSLIYGLSISFLFLSSSLYHAFKKREGEISIWRRLDHFAIFVMIAGTYTPISYIYLGGVWGWSLIITQWTLVIAGFFFKFFALKTPRFLYTLIYLVMGWVGIVSVGTLFPAMSPAAIALLILGGLSFTTGAVFYMLKKPVFSPRFGFHEIFHIFILLGGIFHFFLVLTAVRS